MAHLRAVDGTTAIHDEAAAATFRLLAHDLNNPLTAIRILAEMLRDEVSEGQRRDVLDILEAADLASARLSGFAPSAPEREFTWFPLDLVELVRMVVDRPALRRFVRLQAPREVHLGGDRAALQRLVTDILVNGRRLVDDDGVLEVKVYVDGAEAVIDVVHPGAAIPRGLRPLLFEPYGAIALRQQRVPVSASGLAEAASLADAHGGTLEVADPIGAGEGIIVRVRLPR